METKIDIVLVIVLLLFAFGFGAATANYSFHIEDYIAHPLKGVNHYVCSLDWNYTTPNSYMLQLNYSGAVVKIKENC
jgi:hypothetical protein